MVLLPVLVLLLSGIERLVHAHPNEHPEPDASQSIAQQAFRQLSKRSVLDCLDNPESRNLQKRAADRRQALFETLRAEHLLKRGRTVRDTATALITSHRSNQTGLNQNSNPFGSSVSCTLTPEVEVGPYWVSGEFIRKDLRETQQGVTLFLDIQVIDTKSCKPMSSVYVDVWNCNASGVYGGIVASGNGNAADLSNLNTTYLRGLQSTNTDGVVQFVTNFPGHYPGRTNHIHTIVHLNGTVLPNNTYGGGTIPHIGNILFDQTLISAVEAVTPYSQNTAQVTTNAQDRVFVQETASANDPVVNYVLLGSGVQDGIFGWVTLGVESTADQGSLASAHSIWTASGGVDNPNFNGGLPGLGSGGLPPGMGGYGATGGMGPPFGGMGPPNGGMGPPNGGMGPPAATTSPPPKCS
ncbi:uncharacterized protein LOC129596821 [Paramacrobiotus metropolitanus]|uniref:uncharacterized protein LOC129596821 n=1 Tax=Paramacrobiotus metropolitanus TaxID=2943436 RepID=UPI002446102B|nr:uncharacterized protein LOC129596821 [Paramacrobiotus metropolitanus]